MAQSTRHKLAAMLKQPISIEGVITTSRPITRKGQRIGGTSYLMYVESGQPCRHLWIDVGGVLAKGDRVRIIGKVMKYRSTKGRDNYGIEVETLEVLST